MWKIGHRPITGDLVILNFPENHIADFNPLADQRNLMNSTTWVPMLPTERDSPRAHEQPGLVNAGLVIDRGLEGPMPLILK